MNCIEGADVKSKLLMNSPSPLPDKPYHKAVLVNEVLSHLALKPQGVYIDVTFGGGSHTRAMLLAEPTIKVIAFDWDRTAVETNAPLLEMEFPDRLTVLWGNFIQITQLLKKQKIRQVDGILADFGTSQYQISEQAGFSFSHSTALDMRMSPGHTKTTAYDVVNYASEAELSEIFFTFGEEQSARKIARYIVTEREFGPITTTTQLAQAVMKVVPPYSRSVHPATKVFQALRIFVNDELNNIKSLLTQSLNLLKPQGRMVCISFHSLEDRIVKQFFKAHPTELAILTKKVVTASPEELQLNPSSRSAKLRAAERI